MRKILLFLIISAISTFADGWTSGTVLKVGKHTFNGTTAMRIVPYKIENTRINFNNNF